ncbi:MAG: ImmA/IrrE family metallo-endopeptidase [Opitutaceae bacterium]|nr:ImmA/IrrE family metallo-endopeptidase [Opitutaceae bacterium]
MRFLAPCRSRQRTQDIAALAEHLALSRFSCAPIDPERIAAEEGITMCYASFPQPFDGLLLHEHHRFTLVCNTRCHPRGSPRSRYTVAHELGHFFLPSHRDALVAGSLAARLPRQGPWSNRITESDADCFAANLLMPAALFSRLAATLPGTTPQKIHTLAKTFETSISTTAYRLIELDLLGVPSAAILWDPLGLPAGRRVSPFTAVMGPDYLMLTSRPPHSSATARMIEHLRTGEDHSQSHLMDWFTGLSGYESGHQTLVREEVMSLGDHGWLTLIAPADAP